MQWSFSFLSAERSFQVGKKQCWDRVEGEEITDMQAHCSRLIREFDRFVFIVVEVGGHADEV